MTADAFGRPPRPQTVPSVVPALRAKAAELQVQSRAPQPILLGRHLVELGMEPGPKIGAMVKEAYEAQLEGKFFNLEQAFHWLALQFPDLAESARGAVERLNDGL